MDFLGYKNKRVIVSGCFSGMGEATARLLLELGAQVHGLDYKETSLKLASFTQVDLRDPAAIDAAIAGIGGKVDALFNCAGLPQTAPRFGCHESQLCRHTPRDRAGAAADVRGRRDRQYLIQRRAGMEPPIPVLMELLTTGQLRGQYQMVRGQPRDGQGRLCPFQGGHHPVDDADLRAAHQARYSYQLHDARSHPDPDDETL